MSLRWILTLRNVWVVKGVWRFVRMEFLRLRTEKRGWSIGIAAWNAGHAKIIAPRTRFQSEPGSAVFRLS